MDLTQDQLIYVDWDTKREKVVSFGHNFRYRWRYGDSILNKRRRLASEQERPEVASPENEAMSRDGGQLTGARLLFGYVDGADEAASTGGGSRKLGIVDDADRDSDAARLAGRIAINAALEQCEDGETLDARFITRGGAENMNTDAHHRYTIPLKILGQPRASAVEHYIRQTDKCLKTYGDRPGYPDDETAGDLNGRKFYRHQKKAREEHGLFEDISNGNIASNQSAFAQFISKPGRKFRFTLRFKDLRQWELGAVLLALNPDFAKPDDSEAPRYANKLGHGRPLGLGSVAIRVDAIHLLDEDGELRTEAPAPAPFLQAFAQVVETCGLQQNLDTWKQVLDYAASGACEYPNASHGPIYSYHTNIRADYSKKRRNKEAMTENFGQPVQPGYKGGQR